RRCCHCKCQSHQECHIGSRSQENGNGDRHRSDDKCRDARDHHLFSRAALHSLVNHVCPEVMRKREVEALIVSPATTARIVANAIAEMTAKKMFPAIACASSGALLLVPLGASVG